MGQERPQPLDYDSTPSDADDELAQAKVGIIAALIGMAIGLFFVILMVING